ncbi:UNVERIFIED_CONTAM: hypothetical protein HDU68_000962 [Siphonaria sp. JEL0065]|nr:hypothetical protein HDU68_000962 [Siphonaria sp. JEL0065]
MSSNANATAESTASSSTSTKRFSARDLFVATPDSSVSLATANKALATYDDKLKGKQTHLDNPVLDVRAQEARRLRQAEKKKGTIGKKQRKKQLTRKEKVLLGDVGGQSLGKDANLTYVVTA